MDGGPEAPTPPVRRGRPRLRVVLVDPKYPGNVGSVARVCANFGVDEITLVGGPELTSETHAMAVHAFHLLEKAPHVPTLSDALADVDLSVAFTAEVATKGQDHLRQALSLPHAADRVHAMDGLTALVFGREDYGLLNPELEQCDLVCTIPVDPAYASMNLSHAVAVALYEMSTRHRLKPYAPRAASEAEIERLLATVAHMCRRARFPDHKVRPAVLAVRRLIGRGRLNSWEYHRVMGILSETLKQLKAWPVPEARWSPRDASPPAPQEKAPRP